jgi:hypothetical protein
MNHGFYRLLARRGKRYLFSGVGLHIIHHLTGILSLVIGLADPTVLVTARAGWQRINGSGIGAHVVDVPRIAGEPLPDAPGNVRSADDEGVAAKQTKTPTAKVAA